MLGLFQTFTPKFVKKYANVAEIITNAFKEYAKDKDREIPKRQACIPHKRQS